MRLRSILYHDVVAHDFDESGFPGRAAARYKLWHNEFDDHLKAIASRGVNPIADFEVTAHSPDPEPLLFTVDDGGVSARHIASRLEQRGWRGVFFVTTDHIDQPTFLTRADLRALRKAGHTIGSHTCSHPFRMGQLPPAIIQAEWSNSVAKLEDILGERVESASVPGGFYAPSVAKGASAAHIRWLFTSEPTAATHMESGCTILGRYSVYRGMNSHFAADLAAGKPSAIAMQAALWKAKKLAKTSAGPVWDAARRLFFRLPGG